MLHRNWEVKTNTDPLLAEIISYLSNPIQEKDMIDLCCEKARFTRGLPFKHKTFVDILDWGVEYPGEFWRGDVLEIDGHWDVALALDAIEHFPVSQGLRLINKALKISDMCIFFTPLGELWVDPKDPGNDPRTHKSGWTPGDLPHDFQAFTFEKWHGPPINHGAMIFWKAVADHRYLDLCKIVEKHIIEEA